MDTALAGLATVRPPNTFTTTEFCERYKISLSTAKERLKKLKALGKVENAGRTGTQFYYRLKR